MNGWADVWPVDEDWNDEILNIHIEDEAVISLPENRTTGYRWMLADAPEPVGTPSPPPAPFADPRNTLDVDSEEIDAARRAFLRSAETAEEAAAPEPVMRTLRRRSSPDEGERGSRSPEVGVDVVGDDYLTSRVNSVRPQEARRVRLEVAGGITGEEGNQGGVVAGTTGRRLLGVRFASAGTHTIRLVYRSPYVQGPDLHSYAIHALVETRRVGISIDQLATGDEDTDWLQGVRERQATAAPPALDPNDPALAD